MLYMTVYSFRPQNRDATVARFKKTGGPPPDGVKMIGRWHDAGMHRGWVLAESDSVEGVARWCHQWADLISFQIVPVLDDEQIMGVFSS
jgi:hypothetical protein